MRGGSLLLCVVVACAAPTSRGEQAVTGGTDDPGDPAVIGLVDASGQVGCTATAIGAHTAITAAHCVFGRDPRTLRAVFGASVAAGSLVAIADARTDPGFDPTTFAHDVAMVTLREPSPAPPLALDPRAIDASLVGTTFAVVGFGTTGATADAGQKRTGTARISAVDALELTAAPDPSQPCHGDSGGPALLSPDAVTAVVSRGDAACSDHAIYARIDIARATLVDPYLAATAPGSAHIGDACFYAEHCADGPCLQTHDDPLLYFCSHACTRDADCPSPMTCAGDGCRYPEPSPGALGSPCASDETCTSGTCRNGACTVSCLSAACPAGFACEGKGTSLYCVVAPAGCGGCASGPGSPALLLTALVLLVRGRRTGRAWSPRDSRAGRSARARETRTGS